MAKYKRSIRGGGFRPEQVSERGESRLQEYSNRITTALREERDAVISNRNRIADSLKENAKIESQQASTNADIQQQNVQTQLDAIQAQNAAAQRQFEINTNAQKKIFRTISDFSLTAGKKLQEIEVERLQEKWNQDYYQTLALGDNDPNVRLVEALLKEAQAKQVEGYTALNVEKENGADDLDISEASKKISQLSYGSKLALFNKVAQDYPTYLNEQFMDETTTYTDSQGNTFTGNQASRNAERTSIVAGAAMQRYLDLSRLTGTNPALLQKSGLLSAMLSHNQSVMKTAREANLADNNFEADSAFNSQLANVSDAATATSIIETEFVNLVNRHGLKGAHDYLTKLFQTVDLDGNPIYPEAALFSAKIGSKGGTLEQDHPKRAAEIRKALAKARNTAFQQQEESNQIAAIQDFRLRKDELNAQLSQAGASDDLDIIATAKKAYSDKYNGFIPPQLIELERRVLNENKQEAEAKLEVVKQLAKDGILTQGKVLSIEDPTIRAEAQKLLIEQNKISKFGKNYEKTLEALKGDAKTIAEGSTVGATGTSANKLFRFMEKQFAVWYNQGLTLNNNDPNLALKYAEDKHTKETAKSIAGEETGLYYRNTSADNYNAPEYPNIEKEVKKTQAATDKKVESIINTIGALGISALNSPGLVHSANELRKYSQIHMTGGSIADLITNPARRAAELLGISVIEVINKEIETHNKYNQDKILPIQSRSLDRVNDARPETQRLFTDMPTVGSVERGTAEILQEPLRDPNNMRRAFVNAPNNISLSRYSDQVSSITYDTNQPGIDIFFEDKQFPAVLSGRVKDVGYQGNQQAGYGNFVVVESIDPDTGQLVDVLYSHLESPTVYQPGDVINAGQIIGTQGGTGSVRSYDGTIASIDFLAPAPAGSTSMVPYSNYDQLRRRLAQQLKNQ